MTTLGGHEPGLERQLEELREQQRGTQLGLGIGIEAGYATLGRIGFEGRYDYGVIGPVTNLASRLSTPRAGGQILIGPRLFAAVEAPCRPSQSASSTCGASAEQSSPTRCAGYARQLPRPLGRGSSLH